MIAQIKKDFSLSALIAGFIIVLVGMTSSVVIVLQAAQSFGVDSKHTSSWLGSLCLGMGFLTIYFSLKYKSPVLMAWSTPGAVLLAAGSSGFSLKEAIGAFLFSAFLIFIFGITGWFEKIMKHISLSLTAGLLAGVLVHFCIDAFKMMQINLFLIGTMFVFYLIGRKYKPYMAMFFSIFSGILISIYLGLFNINQIELSTTHFQWTNPEFSLLSIISLGIPLFVITMASQNLTGISVSRSYGFQTPISSQITGLGLVNIVTAFFGGFAINMAAITAAIGMGPGSNPDKDKRYISGIVSGLLYMIIGLFAGTVSSLFAAFPIQLITAITGFALLGIVLSSLETAVSIASEKEAAFITFIVAASGISFFGIGSAFWSIIAGLAIQFFLKNRK